ncbi:VWA domain-containing protein [Sporichthya sp.]|uniref:nitric oxide reductase activation protein NorD n=1 Tax=Sporichthya sp. TaxID=65475 RepID=UPI001805ECF9|nr:VWA domain-containing protein [Sporichthya sp.]MBA3743277.1 VWA domain-containing protein [Sporichthya sp.]
MHGLLIGHGSLVAEALTGLKGSPAHASRYLLLEANRLCAPGGVWARLRDTIGVPPNVPVCDSTRQAVDLAVAGDRLPPTPTEWGVIRPGLLLRAIEDGLVLDAGGSAARRTSVEEGEVLDPGDGSENLDAILRALSLGPLTGLGLGRMLRKRLGLRRRATKSPSGGMSAGEQIVGGWSGQIARRVGGSGLEVSLRGRGGAAVAPESGRFRYAEWDRVSGSYRPRWCTVAEVPSESLNRPLDEPTMSGRDLVMRRRLAKAGLKSQTLLRQAIGDDLDLDAVIRNQIDAASGASPDEKVYAATRPRQRDLSCLVLLDISGSGRDPSPAGGSVFDRQREGALCVLDSLNAIGARTAAYAFRSAGRHSVQVSTIKGFNEAWSNSVPQRVHQLQPGGYTRLGAAIRHAARLLAAETATARKLLVVVSDGFPYDTGYEGEYAAADSRRALAEARHQSIGCVCIALASPAPDSSLVNVFGSAAYARVPDLSTLRAVVPRLFLHGLRTSDPRLRVSQRRDAALRVGQAARGGPW